MISIDLPDTNILGDKFAKVMLRLPDGTEVTVKVPVRVVASQNGDSKPETLFQIMVEITDLLTLKRQWIKRS